MQNKDAKVAVITTQGCPYCKRVKAALKDAAIDFQDVDLTDQLEALASVKKASGQATVPQVFVGGKLIGGASEVVAALQDGSFSKMLKTATNSPPLPQSVAQAVAASSASLAKDKSSKKEANSSNNAAQQQLEDISRAMIAAGIGAQKSTATASSTTTKASNRPPSAPFSIKQALQWLYSEKGSTDAEAIETLASMQLRQMVTIVQGVDVQTPLTASLAATQPEVLLEWTGLRPLPTKWDQPLNSQFEWFGGARPAVEVSADLRQRILSLYDTHLTPDGRRVNYKAMSQDPAFLRFTLATAELQAVDVQNMDREESMCFWINLYNCAIVHATAAVGPAKTTLDRLRWFDLVGYIVGGRKFSCNDIEHGVLRGNAPSPASLLSLVGFSKWAPPIFSSSDSRRNLSLTPVDPRIHFALNCGATSCPPIRVYSPGRLEVGLSSAAAAFCAGEVSVNVSAREVLLSSIFKWYGGDFGKKEDLLRFLIENVPENIREQLEEVVRAAGGAEGVSLKYKPYDWSVNAVE